VFQQEHTMETMPVALAESDPSEPLAAALKVGKFT
jgi:hypothetical protein